MTGSLSSEDWTIKCLKAGERWGKKLFSHSLDYRYQPQKGGQMQVAAFSGLGCRRSRASPIPLSDLLLPSRRDGRSGAVPVFELAALIVFSLVFAE